MSDIPPQIIIKRVKKRGHGHHGGAWKVAYADFVTAMMAFFLVMWIIGVGTRQQKAAISEYFRNPSATPGNATLAPPGQMGPGGASDSMIQLGGAMDLSHGPGKDHHNGPVGTPSQAEIEKRASELDRAHLQELKDELNAAIQNSQALAPFKDQLLLDITPEGLRIQIVDKLNRPMFDLGSARLKDYTQVILGDLAKFINRVPNHISITGHTDDASYDSNDGYSNWELSTDRANAARRALIAGGLLDDKVSRVVGLAASVPLDKANPGDPVNRRISIIVMTRQAEAAALSSGMVDSALLPGKDGAAPATPKPDTPSAPAPAGSAHVQAAPAGQPAPTIATLPVPPVLHAAGSRQGAG
ncbi:flagellar motor protein MotB [Rhodanobacter sp. DHB23]|uniref:flagellar motor protein MotB n=1 Tax=Rhodanobacter sp. DHB23 TaxID=2775923 RepID=UPI00178677F3|nr:flagellar motor protein MotB [Rhodanobacter sp. DHB23]MBD8871390.1 flagellar motor protein MotB [Rhodanobacter sp. DHB23]